MSRQRRHLFGDNNTKPTHEEPHAHLSDEPHELAQGVTDAEVVEADRSAIISAHHAGLPALAQLLSTQVVNDFAARGPAFKGLASILVASAKGGRLALFQQTLEQARDGLRQVATWSPRQLEDIVDDLSMAATYLSTATKDPFVYAGDSAHFVDVVDSTGRHARCAPALTQAAMPPSPAAPNAPDARARMPTRRKKLTLPYLLRATQEFPPAVRLFADHNADMILSSSKQRKVAAATQTQRIWMALSARERASYVRQAGADGLSEYFNYAFTLPPKTRKA